MNVPVHEALDICELSCIILYFSCHVSCHMLVTGLSYSAFCICIVSLQVYLSSSLWESPLCHAWMTRLVKKHCLSQMSVSAKWLCEVSSVLEKCLGQHPWKESRESSKMIENLAHKHLPICQAFAISHQTTSDSRVCCLHRREIIGCSQSNAEEEKIGIGVFKAPKFSLVRYLWFFPMKMKAPSFILRICFFVLGPASL